MSALYTASGLKVLDESIGTAGSPYLSTEVDLPCETHLVGIQISLTGPSTPVGDVTFEGRLDSSTTNGGTRPWVDLGLDAIALADVDAAVGDSVLVGIDALVRGLRVRVTVSSGSATRLEIVATAKAG